MMRSFRLSHLIATFGVLIGLIVWFLPTPAGANPQLMPVAGVVIVAVSLWATSAVPEYFTAIIFFFLAMGFKDRARPLSSRASTRPLSG